jgi:predicted Zn-dependent peptidase
MKEFYQPERMVLAGVGIDHQKLVDLGQKYFSVPKNENQIIDQQANKAVWTGGVVMVRSKALDSFQKWEGLNFFRRQ